MIEEKLNKSFTVQICGGLGNQMFQYAFAKAISVEKKVPFKLDLQYFNLKSDRAIIRPYELNIFRLKEPLLEKKKIILQRFNIFKNKL